MRLLSRVSLFLCLVNIVMVLPLYAQNYWVGLGSTDFSDTVSNWNMLSGGTYSVGPGWPFIDPVLDGSSLTPNFTVNLFVVGNFTGVGNLTVGSGGVLNS